MLALMLGEKKYHWGLWDAGKNFGDKTHRSEGQGQMTDTVVWNFSEEYYCQEIVSTISSLF